MRRDDAARLMRRMIDVWGDCPIEPAFLLRRLEGLPDPAATRGIEELMANKDEWPTVGVLNAAVAYHVRRPAHAVPPRPPAVVPEPRGVVVTMEEGAAWARGIRANLNRRRGSSSSKAADPSTETPGPTSTPSTPT